MTGKSHKAIGTAVGAAIAIYGARQGEYVFALALVTAPLAAMLPDIDHGSARIGKLRRLVANIIVTAAAIAVVVAAWIHGRFILENYTNLLMIGIGVIIPTFFLFKLSQTKWVRDTWGFVTKHRGVMHTLIIPICALAATMYIRDRYFLILTYGFLAGYVSHILGDCMTTKGCPILFPLYRKNIRFMNIKTGTRSEQVQAVIMIILIILTGALIPIAV
ncbi:MAG: metal-dependent hydrolase [Defluviitaleaceae bacterium]|nr:metal-dependent hydrolase [Defluviitaleaceae bacterium]